MKKITAAAFVAALLLADATAGAHADGPLSPGGVLCDAGSIPNPQAEDGTQTGEISAGPVTLLDSNGNVRSGTLTCTIQLNSAIHNGTSNDAVSVSAHGTGVVAMPPTVVSFQAGDDQPVYLCTQFTYDGDVTLYHRSTSGSRLAGSWSTDPNSTCRRVTMTTFGDAVDLVDSVICPPLALVLPPQGDVPGIWDCPPYGW